MADDGAGSPTPEARLRPPRRRMILTALTGVVVIGMAAAGITVFLTQPPTISVERGNLYALATAELDGRPVLVSGGGTIQVWDPDTGAQIGRSITFGDGRVSSIATAEVDDRPVIISADAWQAHTQRNPDRSRMWLPPSEGLRIWDLATGARIGRPLLDTGWVNSLTTAELDGRTVVVAVSSYGLTVAAWDLTTGAIVGDRLTGDFAVTALATAQLDGRPIIIASGETEPTTTYQLRVFDLASGAPIGQPLIGHTSYAKAVTTAQLDGRTVVISSGSDDMIRVWDLATGDPVGQPLDMTGTMVWSLAAAQLDGRTVIALGDLSGTIRLVDIDQLRA